MEEETQLMEAIPLELMKRGLEIEEETLSSEAISFGIASIQQEREGPILRRYFRLA